jgi:putative transposase
MQRAEGVDPKKALRPPERREAASFLVAEQGIPVGRACGALGMCRSSFYKTPQDRLERDAAVIQALQEMVKTHSRWGFWKCFDRMRLDGSTWNHKRVHRVYRELRLNQPRRTKKRFPTREPQPLGAPSMPNEIWSLDFMHDTLYVGRRFRVLNVLDEGVREALGIEVDTSLSAERVVRVMEQIKEWRGVPKAIRCDNGPELTAETFVDWCRSNEIEIRYIQPGKPNQNAFIERFNRSFRNEVLNAHLFEDLDQVREVVFTWMMEYNEIRPHDALGRVPPTQFRKAIEARNSTYELST